MKKINFLVKQIVLLFAVIQCVSCNKLIDKIYDGPGGNKKTCNIKTIKQLFAYGNDVYRNGKFYYNSKGQPTKVTFDSLNSVSPWHYFEYHKDGRLKEFRSEWDHGREFYTAIHHYGYSPSGLIVIDTAYLQIEGEFNVISHLEYDNKKRIVKEIEYILNNDNTTTYFREHEYNYDSNGNLIIDGVTYDNKRNYLSTNIIWMFIQRNFSKNNPTGAVGYNNKGLPLGFTDGFSAFLGYGSPAEITYDCEK